MGQNWSCSCQPVPEPQRHQIWVISVTYSTAHSHAGSLSLWAESRIKPTTSWILVGSVNAEPQQELPVFIFMTKALTLIFSSFMQEKKLSQGQGAQTLLRVWAFVQKFQARFWNQIYIYIYIYIYNFRKTLLVFNSISSYWNCSTHFEYDFYLLKVQIFEESTEI